MFMQSIQVKSHIDSNGILSLSLPEIRDTDVEVTIIYQKVKPTPKSFLQTAKSLNLQGNPDWSTNIN